MKKYLLSVTVLLVATQSFAHMSVGDSVSYRHADNRVESKTVVSINSEEGALEVSFDDGRGTSGIRTDKNLAKLNQNEEALVTCAPINTFKSNGKKLPSIKVEAGEFFDVCYYEQFNEQMNARVEGYYSPDVPWQLLKAEITKGGETVTMELSKFNKAKE